MLKHCYVNVVAEANIVSEKPSMLLIFFKIILFPVRCFLIREPREQSFSSNIFPLGGGGWGGGGQMRYTERNLKLQGTAYDKRCQRRISPLTTSEEIENGGFTLKTHQMFSVFLNNRRSFWICQINSDREIKIVSVQTKTKNTGVSKFLV